MIDIGSLAREGAKVLKKNYTLALPTVFAGFVVSFISLAVLGGQPDTMKLIIMGFVAIFMSLYAHGVTLAMAREAMETGRTSMGTAALIAFRLAGRLATASALIGLAIGAGSMLYLLPGLFAAFFLMFALPSMMVDMVGVFEAIKRGIVLARKKPKDSATLFFAVLGGGLAVGMVNLILNTVPVAGQLLGVALSGAFGGFVAVVMVRAYKTLGQKITSGDTAA